jgi:endonuclease YncB( thermonuclease family)
MGRLRARGVLKLAQFWPDGNSDADTANLTVSLTLDPPFAYRPDQGVEKATRVFHDAHWKDRGKPKPVLGTKRDKLRVRLQGIDAPELHYKPPIKGTKDFRQNLAESAVFALRKMLIDLAAGSKELRADVVTFVESPNDAFDMYGRYVGNVTVYADGFAVDINHWLLEHGWAVPGLYNSMTERELTVARTLSAAAAAANSGLYKSTYYKNKLVAFDWKLVRRPASEAKNFRLYDDKGDVMNPKFFRRQAQYELKERNKPSGKNFYESLQEAKDYRALTWDVLRKLPAAARRDAAALKKKSVLLGSLMTRSGVLPRADDLIHIEGPGDIVAPDGKTVINKWDFATGRARGRR